MAELTPLRTGSPSSRAAFQKRQKEKQEAALQRKRQLRENARREEDEENLKKAKQQEQAFLNERFGGVSRKEYQQALETLKKKGSTSGAGIKAQKKINKFTAARGERPVFYNPNKNRFERKRGFSVGVQTTTQDPRIALAKQKTLSKKIDRLEAAGAFQKAQEARERAEKKSQRPFIPAGEQSKEPTAPKSIVSIAQDYRNERIQTKLERGENIKASDIIPRGTSLPLTPQNIAAVQSIYAAEKQNVKSRLSNGQSDASNSGAFSSGLVSQQATRQGRFEPSPRLRGVTVFDKFVANPVIALQERVNTAAMKEDGSVRGQLLGAASFVLAFPRVGVEAVKGVEFLTSFDPGIREQRKQAVGSFVTQIRTAGVANTARSLGSGAIEGFKSNPGLLGASIAGPKVSSGILDIGKNTLTRLSPGYRPVRTNAFGIEEITDIQGKKGTVNIDLVPEGTPKKAITSPEAALRDYGGTVPLKKNPSIPKLSGIQKEVFDLAKERGDVQTGSFAQSVLLKEGYSRRFGDLDVVTDSPAGFIDEFNKRPIAKRATVEKVTIPKEGGGEFDIFRIKNKKGTVLADIDPLSSAEEGAVSRFPFIEVEGAKFIDPRVRLYAKTQQLNKKLYPEKYQKVVTDIRQLTGDAVNLEGQAVRGGFGFSIEEQLAFQGKTGNVATAQRSLFGIFKKELTVDKPAPPEVPLERSLFASPFDPVTGRAQLRKSRLGVDSLEGSLLDVLSGEATFGTGKPQAVVFENQRIAPLPKNVFDQSGNIRPDKLLDFQLRPTGEFKPVGFIGGEAEFTLAPGEIIVKKGVIGRTIINGKSVPIISADVARANPETARLLSRVEQGTPEESLLFKRLSAETGFSVADIRRSSRAPKPTYNPLNLISPVSGSAALKYREKDPVASYAAPSGRSKKFGSAIIPTVSSSPPARGVFPSSFSPQKTRSPGVGSGLGITSGVPRSTSGETSSGLFRSISKISSGYTPYGGYGGFVPRSPRNPIKKNRKDKPERLVEGFSTFVKRQGEFVKVGGSLTESEALALGQRITETGAERSFFIKESGRLIKGGSTASPFASNRYRRKKARGRGVSGDVFVEKSAYAINTIGELYDITYKSNRRKKKK